MSNNERVRWGEGCGEKPSREVGKTKDEERNQLKMLKTRKKKAKERMTVGNKASKETGVSACVCVWVVGR